MLTEEQRQALHARLSEAAPEPAPVIEQQPDASEGGSSDAQGQGEPTGGDTAPEQKTETGGASHSEKQVPLDKHVRVRQERNALKLQLQEAKEKLARLEGFKEAASTTDQEWLDKISGKEPEAQEPANPLDTRLSQVEKYMQEVERREGQLVLTQVLDACTKKDPTAPRQFLVDAFAAGETPEQALGRWQAWTAGMRQTQAAPAAKPAPTPAPTVSRVPPGPPSNKPQTWKDVSSAVRQAMGIK